VNVGASYGLKFGVLRSSIIIEHSLGSSTRCCEVTVALVHPVGPRSELTVVGVSSISNLSGTLNTVETSTKLGEHHRDTISFSVISSNSGLVEMVGTALVGK